jgi:hypothetical protein
MLFPVFTHLRGLGGDYWQWVIGIRVGRVLRSFDSVIAWIGVCDCHFENFHLGCMGK